MFKQCSRRLLSPDELKEPCPGGIEYAEKQPNRCDWGVVSSTHYFCFFEYMKYHSYPHEVAEIAEVLGVSTKEVDKILESALEKIREQTGAVDVLKSLHVDIERSTPVDISIYESEEKTDPHLYSRQKGEAVSTNYIHSKTGKPSVYGLSVSWKNHLDKDKFKVNKPTRG